MRRRWSDSPDGGFTCSCQHRAPNKSVATSAALGRCWVWRGTWRRADAAEYLCSPVEGAPGLYKARPRAGWGPASLHWGSTNITKLGFDPWKKKSLLKLFGEMLHTTFFSNYALEIKDSV